MPFSIELPVNTVKKLQDRWPPACQLLCSFQRAPELTQQLLHTFQLPARCAHAPAEHLSCKPKLLPVDFSRKNNIANSSSSLVCSTTLSLLPHLCKKRTHSLQHGLTHSDQMLDVNMHAYQPMLCTRCIPKISADRVCWVSQTNKLACKQGSMPHIAPV